MRQVNWHCRGDSEREDVMVASKRAWVGADLETCARARERDEYSAWNVDSGFDVGGFIGDTLHIKMVKYKLTLDCACLDCMWF